MPDILDPDVNAFVGVANSLKRDYSNEKTEEKWKCSPFNWIRPLPPAQKGKLGMLLISGWCGSLGLNVTRSGSSQRDKIIGGRSVEGKFSMLWANNTYTFEQIRDQDYEYLICFGISPFDAHCWVIPKRLAMQKATPQHGGKFGRDTRWFKVDPQSPPDWLLGCGGCLRAARAILGRWHR